MKNVMETLRSLNNDESGQDLIEYALIAALLSLGAVATMKTLSTGINSVFTSINGQLTAA
jgi:pilus assembly protein Flp/PilA